MNSTLIVLLIYLALMFGVAWFFSRKESLSAYFLNSKRTSLWFMTFSTVATVIGAGAVVGIVSEVYNSGISYGIVLPVSGIVGMLILGFMAKKIKRIGDEYGAYTIVDFFGKRFDTKNKILTGILQIFLLIIWISVQAIAIASLATVLVGFEYDIALILAAGITVLYTAVGGLRVDIMTDFIQFWIILIVFFIMALYGYSEVGGLTDLVNNVPRGHFNPFGFGGASWFIGGILLSGFIYLANTSHWQRIFSAENKKIAQTSFFLSIPFVALIALIVLFLGLVAVVILPGVNQDTALFSLMNNILPPWLVGVGFAAVIAVVMSSIDSLLIGGSSIIFKAIFKKNEFSEKKEIFYARLITGVFGVCGFVLAFLVPSIVTLSLLVAYLALIFVPSIIGGLYSNKISSNASFYSILISFILLVITFPLLEENSFILPTLTATLIVIFYDKIFKKKT